MTFPTQAIILAGGKGTRLQSIVNDLPKPMAAVNGIPFLSYVMDNLIEQGIKHIILSVGYKHEKITNYYSNSYKDTKISYAIEHEALGTGGAIKLASENINDNLFWVINGDTYVDIDLQNFYNINKNNNISIGLVKMQNFERYGRVFTDFSRITGFKEKEYCESGLINSGVYLINKKYLKRSFPESQVFSFEKDVLELVYNNIDIGFFESNGLFIDIGVPEDYFRAQKIFTNSINAKSIFDLDNSWTIFLDRDGVINERIPGNYVKSPLEFKFLPQVKEAIKKLSEIFNRIIIVTNQQGIGKGIVSKEEVDKVNEEMVSEIAKSGGKITKVYTCSMLKNEQDNCRKPNPHMAIWAKNDFPDIDFQKSIIIGDSISDMEFGKHLGMKTILVETKEEEKMNYPIITVDGRIDGLKDFI